MNVVKRWKGLVLSLIGFIILDILFYLPSIVIKETRNPLYYAVLAFVFFFVFAVILRITKTGTFRSIGLTKSPGWQGPVKIGLLAGTVVPASIFLLEAALRLIEVRSIEPLLAWFPILGIALLQYAFVAFGEELLLRGYLFHHLLKSFSSITTIILASVIFAAHHWQHYDQGWINMLRLFSDGIFYGLIYMTSRTLWYTIAAHLMINTSAILFSIVVKYDLVNGDLWIHDIMPFFVLPLIYFIVIWHQKIKTTH